MVIKVPRVAKKLLILLAFGTFYFSSISTLNLSSKLRRKLTHTVGAYFLYTYLKEWIANGSPVYTAIQNFLAKRRLDSLSQSQYLSPEMQKRCRILFWLWKETAAPEVKMLVTENLDILKTICCKNNSQLKEKIILASLKLRLQKVQYDSSWPPELKDFLLGKIKKLMGKKSFVEERQFCLLSGHHNESFNVVLLNKLSFLLGREPLVVDCKLLREDDICSAPSGNNLYGRPNIFTKLYLERKPGINYIIIKNLEALKSPRDIKALHFFFQKKLSPFDPAIGDSLNFAQDFIATTTEDPSFVQTYFKDALKVFDLGKQDSRGLFCRMLKNEYLEQQVTVRRALLSVEDKKCLLSFYQEHYSHKNFSKFLTSFFAEFDQNGQKIHDALAIMLQKKELKEELFSPESFTAHKLLKLNLPEFITKQQYLSVAQKCQEELRLLMRTENYNNIEVVNYLKILLKFSILKHSSDYQKINLDNVQKKLNFNHFGLDDLKHNIINFLIMKKSSVASRGKVLLLVGPPGVGKTSIAKSIASALDKPFATIFCPGIINRAYLCGLPRAYKFPKEGLLLGSLLQSNALDPVVLIDEVDKISENGISEILAPLLQALDPLQNKNFFENYLEVNIDLSNIFFILSANNLNNIPAALLDRCDVIKMSGYTTEDKIVIAQNYLLPKIINNLKPECAQLINISPETIVNLVNSEDSGVGLRGLTKKLEDLVVDQLQKSLFEF